MTIEQRITQALDNVRKANAAAETLQTHEFIVDGQDRASLLSSIRINLSVAAADLAQALDTEPSDPIPFPTLKPLRVTSVK